LIERFDSWASWIWLALGVLSTLELPCKYVVLVGLLQRSKAGINISCFIQKNASLIMNQDSDF